VRILLVHNYYKQNQIGGEDLVFSHELSLLSERLGTERVFSYSVHNDQATIWSAGLRLFLPLRQALEVRWMVKKNGIDLVHLHNELPLLTLWAMRVLRGLQCVRVQTLHNYRRWCISGILYRPGKGICEDCIQKSSRIHGVLHACYRGSRLQSLILFLAQTTYRFFSLYDEVDYYFCVSEHQRRKLLSFGLTEERVILKPNPVRIPVYDGPFQKVIDFLFVGRIEESKGILMVLDRVDSGMRSRIQVIGYAENLDELRKKYPEVVFYGRMNPDRVLEMMKRARYLLQSSIWFETFGLTMIESMGVGTPVIGFPIGTRNELIQDGVNGFFMSEPTIQEDLQRALNYPNYDSLCRGARITAERFRDHDVVESQIALYDLLIRRGRGVSR
jgi:glycosyltransferase involved in cell wall biosynthesis